MSENNFSWPEGVKKTKQRMEIFSVLEKADKPMSAFSISQKLGGGTDKNTWLSTVYRTLDLFEKEKIITKISIMDKDMALYTLNRFAHHHYAVCVGCHDVIKMENCPMETFAPNLTDKSFHILGHKIELYGYCTSCELQVEK